MSKHTPGPWVVDELKVVNGRLWAAVTTPKGDLVYLTLIPTDVEANARLIAAAPEMLEALRDIKEAVVDGLSDGRNEGSALCLIEEIVREAIAKAEGA